MLSHSTVRKELKIPKEQGLAIDMLLRAFRERVASRMAFLRGSDPKTRGTSKKPVKLPEYSLVWKLSV